MILVFLTSGFCCGPKQLLAGQGAGRLSGTRFNFRVVFRVEVRDKQTTGLRAREVVDKHTKNLIPAHILLIPLKISLSKLFRDYILLHFQMSA